MIHLISLYEGITISELLRRLKVTKQSLNRVLKDLIKLKTIKYIKDNKKLDYSKLSKNIYKFSKKNNFKFSFYFDQRYDLSNHITWMKDGTPGGSGKYNNIFSKKLISQQIYYILN